MLIGNVAVDETEVGARVEAFGIVERGTVVDLVERDDVVGLRVGQGKVSDNPGASFGVSALRPGMESVQYGLHESCPSSYKDVLDAGIRAVSCGA